MFKLIIVEDEHLIRKWLEIAVDYSALGIQVVGTASHGQEGMELIQDKDHILSWQISPCQLWMLLGCSKLLVLFLMKKLSYLVMTIFKMPKSHAIWSSWFLIQTN